MGTLAEGPLGRYDFGGIGGEIESDAGLYLFNDLVAWPPAGTVQFSRIADTSFTPSGASGPFTSFGPVSYKGQVQGKQPGNAGTFLAERATAGGVDGIYEGAENLANVGDVAPDASGKPNADGAVFTSFGDPVATNNEITFTAHYGTYSGDQQGIFSYGPYYSTNDGTSVPSLTELVSTGQIAPIPAARRSLDSQR